MLIEGDDPNEPVSDTVRGILDGHLVLSRKLAQENHWPAVHVLSSISRLMPEVTTPEQQESAGVLRRILAARAESEDLVSIGAYREGTNPLVDAALQLAQPIDAFLQQQRVEHSTFAGTGQQLTQLRQSIGQLLESVQNTATS